jgi:hypothetical protein
MSSPAFHAGCYAEMTVTSPVSAGQSPPPRVFRPILIGPAVLHRRRSDDRWRVEVSRDGRLLPSAATCEETLQTELRARRRSGRLCRVAAALISPEDALHVGITVSPSRNSLDRRQPRLASYGWALLYQPPGIAGLAFVDRHEQFAELPACFELPLELLDRAAFLASRGFRTRPLAVVAQPEDFDRCGHHRFSSGGNASQLERPRSFWPPSDRA